MAYSNQTMAIMKADKEARETGKQKMIVFNTKTGLYSIKEATKKKLKSEKIIYYTR